MRFLAAAALALLLVGVANASIKLTYPEFIEAKTHIYDVWMNISSGVPGMHSQVAKAAMNMELHIYAVPKTHEDKKQELYVSFENVQVSKSVASVQSKTAEMEMVANSDLEEQLRIPIEVTYENGKVVSYTLDEHESLESKKIKKSILRQLEVKLDKKALTGTTQPRYPVTYNHTRSTPVGNFSSHYIITSSPYTDFPKEKNVINITRTDNLEAIPYLAYHAHHNFEEQGCPGVCKKGHFENRFSAGCPVNYEPYQTPMKKSFIQHHNMRKLKTENTLILDIIKSKETHVADIYDQNMEVDIEAQLVFRDTSRTPIPKPTGQQVYTDLNDWGVETHEEEVNMHCKYTTAHEAIPKVKELLGQITEVVHKGSIEGDAKNVGEKLVLLQKALSLLKRQDLDKIQEEIVTYEEMSTATEEERIKRQIWLENLPLIGTHNAISLIVELIKHSINEKYHRIISLWEAKNILEALPMNIVNPTSKTISELSELIEYLTHRNTPGYGMYYSAVNMAVARIIRNMCSVSNGIPEVDEDNKPNYLQMLLRETNDDYKNSRCPKIEAKTFVKNIDMKLKGNTDRLKRIIYIEALSQTGLSSAIPILKPYVQGHIVEKMTPSYLDYVRSVAIHALHNLVGKHPKQIKDIVIPIFSNKTEPPKIRTAAFSVFIRSYPTLGDLQHVAEESWHEPSTEVASYMYSTMETFGNSTNPCDQLTAGRIKKVVAQMKRFTDGKHHAQNILRTVFDDVRGFGIDHRIEFTPSNESFIPSTIYAAMGYNADSLRDSFFKFAINSQGFNSLNMWDNLLNATLNIAPAENIPKGKESAIFPGLFDKNGLADRANEFWRFTMFQKIFYSMSYYYMDDTEYQRGDFITLLRQHLRDYFTVERDGRIHGHIIKVWLPSTYQSKAFAQTLPYPVQFEMRNPMLLSLKVNVKHQGPKYEVDVHPSHYHSMLYSNEILNLGDCKRVGVYHEKKVASTYPVKLSFSIERGHYQFSYSFPELPKKIFTYHSEAGTSTRKHAVEHHSRSEKKTIKTIPTQFVRNSTFSVFGLPPFHSSVLTEDISMGYEEVPRNHEEALYQAVQDFLNAGWRRKTIEISRRAHVELWDTKTEVKFNFSHDHTFQKSRHQGKYDDSWMNKIKFDTQDERKSTAEENSVHDNIKRVSHLQDRVRMTVEHRHGGRSIVKAHLGVLHRRTLEGILHTLQVTASVPYSGLNISASTKFAAVYFGRPNEFKYGEEGYGKQKGIVFGSFWLPNSTVPYMATKVLLSYKPLEHHMNKELQTELTSKDFYPETHEQCVSDVEKGNTQSVACIKAIRELSIYNNVKARFYWAKEIHPVFQEILEKIEQASRHAFFRHMSSHKRSPRYNKTMSVEAVYINKLTDTPVVDVTVEKPSEVLKFHKVDPGFIQPISSIHSVRDSYIHAYTNNTYPATCTLDKKNIKTYDMKTIRFSHDQTCSYVLSAHCVRHKKFVVNAKIDPERPTSREIIIHLGKHSIVLTPGAESKFDVKYDERTFPVYHLQPLMLNDKEKIYAVTTRTVSGTKYIEIYAEKAGIKVTYDGAHVKVQVHPRYKGELCGLCSEFNGEKVMEMRGPNRCLFSRTYHYLNSNALGSCYKYKGTPESAMCAIDDYENSDILDQDDPDDANRNKEYQPKLRRNHVLKRGDDICFSTRPLNACESHDVQKQTESKQVPFHCLPKGDNMTRKLLIESKRRSLGEMETKKVDTEEIVQVPTLCAQR